MSLFSSLWKFLSVARLPRVTMGFTDNTIAVLEMKRRQNRFNIERIASAPLPSSLLQPDFDTVNILQPKELASHIHQLTERAGLARHSTWSIVLPEATARSVIINFDSKPESQQELEQTIAWRVERVLGIPTAKLHLARQPLSTSGPPRFLVTAIQDAILSEYESLFQTLGWHTGLMMPRHLAESLWLARDNETTNKLLISYNDWGFVAVGLQGEEPVMIRSQHCEHAERENELYRLATYYREKVLQQTDKGLHLLVIGETAERELTAQTFTDALSDFQFQLITLENLGLSVADQKIAFPQFAGAAAIATLAYN